MPVNLLGLGLATPGNPIPQSDLFELARRFNADDDTQRTKLKRIYRGTKVRQRHSVLSLSGNGAPSRVERLYSFYDEPGRTAYPGTRSRMAEYERHALPLATRACEQALDDSAADPSDITQLITVSCTGFRAPGLDLGLIDTLGLYPTVGRTHIGFMGCHGAINGLRVADAFASGDPGQRVLLCCAELCTLHFQYGSDPQDAVANAIFADGAAAVVAGHSTDAPPLASTRSFFSTRLEATESMMSWQIGDEGFRMRLDSKVPDQIQGRLHETISAWLATQKLDIDDIAGWVIHPGGPKILDAVESALQLPPDATAASREVLRDYGNMSSPTILFILDELRRRGVPAPWVALGFGPGLVIEAVLFQ